MIIFTAVFLVSAFSSVNGLLEDFFSLHTAKSNPEVQTKAARDVLTRLLGPDRQQLFNVIVKKEFSINGMDSFHIYKNQSDDTVTIVGSNGISVTWGFYYYLKNYCNCHVSWDGDQLNLPPALPSVNITKSSIDKFRYYQNVCTSSYSFVWWDWPRWEREIDWMALNGINLALAFTAQEAIWERVFDGLGLPKTEFTGPAFLAWNRMGNIRNFGRGLSENWHNESIRLQHLILKRMREIGIIPVLPAFSGILPKSFTKVYPTASVLNISKWNNFNEEFCCPYLLNPEDPMFLIISRLFLREYILEFGTDHIYNCDSFNENIPSSNKPEYLRNMAKSIYEGITQIDPAAVWMIQGWMFIHPFWGREQVRAFVTGVPIGKMLILDLQADLRPQFENFNSYYGQPFIWCTLHNFGGQLGIYGYLNLVNKGVVKGRNVMNTTMIGIGIAPEGIDQNYIMYEFTLDSAFRHGKVNITKWISSYILRRYNVFNDHLVKAWFILKETTYNFNPEVLQQLGVKFNNLHNVHIAKNILTKRPSLTMSEILWYSRSEMWEVFQRFIEASKFHNVSSSELFRHDFIDITRQTIQLAVGSLYNQLMAYYATNNSENFQSTSKLFLEILDDLEKVLSTGKKFLLGKWLNDAKKLAKNSNETLQYEYNARNQITLWGPKGEIRDYAAKQWSGMVTDFYKPRWNIFISALNRSLVEDTPYDSSAVRAKIFSDVEQPFTLSNKVYPTTPSGDTIEVINNFNIKWNDTLYNLFQNSKNIKVRFL